MNEKEQKEFANYLVAEAKSQNINPETYIKSITKDEKKLREAYNRFQAYKQKAKQKAEHGAKLTYIKQLSNKCAEDEELYYYKKGGTVGCGCKKKKMAEGGPAPKKVSNVVNEFKKSREKANPSDTVHVNGRIYSVEDSEGKLRDPRFPRYSNSQYQKDLKSKKADARARATKQDEATSYKKGDKICPKCGQVHKAGLGCTVAKFKMHRYGGAILKFLNGKPVKNVSPWRIGASRINEAIRLRRLADYNRHYITTEYGLPQSLDPENYPIQGVESFEYAILSPTLDRVKVRKNDAEYDRDFDPFRKVIGLKSSNATTVNSKQTINQEQTSTSLTSTSKTNSSQTKNQTLTPSPLANTVNSSEPKLNTRSTVTPKVRRKTAEEWKVIHNNKIGALTQELRLKLLSLGIDTSTTRSLLEGINLWYKALNINKSLITDNKFGKLTGAALNEILNYTPLFNPQPTTPIQQLMNLGTDYLSHIFGEPVGVASINPVVLALYLNNITPETLQNITDIFKGKGLK